MCSIDVPMLFMRFLSDGMGRVAAARSDRATAKAGGGRRGRGNPTTNTSLLQYFVGTHTHKALRFYARTD